MPIDQICVICLDAGRLERPHKLGKCLHRAEAIVQFDRWLDLVFGQLILT
jgi:hypothetical protein